MVFAAVASILSREPLDAIIISIIVSLLVYINIKDIENCINVERHDTNLYYISTPTRDINIRVNLDNYNSTKTCTTTGKMICTITASGCAIMPKGGPSLSKCDIRKIQIWAATGCLQ